MKEFKPVKIRDVDLAFPATVVGTLLPLWSDIPNEFREDRTEWTALVGRWFALGLSFVPEVKPEFNKTDVWRHLKACMSSFEPKHEHKVAGVALLMSQWCEPLPKDWRMLPPPEKK
jgi:hypothetical protein